MMLVASCWMFPSCTEENGNREDNPIDEPILVKDPIRYLALGHSYTIGQSVAPFERYPRQLADSLNTAEFFVKDLEFHIFQDIREF